MIDRVAHQMHQRVVEVFDHGFVDLGFLAFEYQLDILAQAARQIARQARVFLEQAADRLHAGFHHRVLQVAHQEIELAHRLVERL